MKIIFFEKALYYLFVNAFLLAITFGAPNPKKPVFDPTPIASSNTKALTDFATTAKSGATNSIAETLCLFREFFSLIEDCQVTYQNDAPGYKDYITKHPFTGGLEIVKGSPVKITFKIDSKEYVTVWTESGKSHLSAKLSNYVRTTLGHRPGTTEFQVSYNYVGLQAFQEPKVASALMPGEFDLEKETSQLVRIKGSFPIRYSLTEADIVRINRLAMGGKVVYSPETMGFTVNTGISFIPKGDEFNGKAVGEEISIVGKMTFTAEQKRTPVSLGEINFPDAFQGPAPTIADLLRGNSTRIQVGGDGKFCDVVKSFTISHKDL